MISTLYKRIFVSIGILLWVLRIFSKRTDSWISWGNDRVPPCDNRYLLGVHWECALLGQKLSRILEQKLLFRWQKPIFGVRRRVKRAFLRVQARNLEVLQPNLFGPHKTVSTQAFGAAKFFEIFNFFGKRPVFSKKIAASENLQARTKPKASESEKNHPLSRFFKAFRDF